MLVRTSLDLLSSRNTCYLLASLTSIESFCL